MARSFWLLWTARITSRLGDGFYFIAVSWLIFQRTHAILPLGAAWAAYLLLTGIGQALLGPVPDLWDRRRLLVSLDLMRGILILLAIFALYRLPQANIAIIYALFVLTAILGLPYSSASGALTAELLPQDAYRRGNVWLQGGIEATYFVGPALGGIFIARFGPLAALAFNAATFLFSAVLITQLPQHVPPVPRRDVPSYRSSLLDGARAIAEAPSVYLLTLLEVAYSSIDAAFLVLSVPLVRAVLHAGPLAVGMLEAAGSLGVIAVSPALQPLARWRPRVFLIGAPLFVLATGAIALVPALSWSICTQIAAGIGSGIFGVEVDTSFQSIIPGALLGRTLMLRRSLGALGTALMALIAAVLAEKVGIGTAFALVGLTGLLLTFWPTRALAVRSVEGVQISE